MLEDSLIILRALVCLKALLFSVVLGFQEPHADIQHSIGSSEPKFDLVNTKLEAFFGCCSGIL